MFQKILIGNASHVQRSGSANIKFRPDGNVLYCGMD
jgi:hypothetical protein